MLAFRTECWGGLSLKWKCKKYGHQMCSPNPLLLKVTVGVGYPLPIVCHGAKIGLYCQGMSQLFLPVSTWYILICPMCRSCSASFLISFRGNGSISLVQFSHPVMSDSLRPHAYFAYKSEVWAVGIGRDTSSLLYSCQQEWLEAWTVGLFST